MKGTTDVSLEAVRERERERESYTLLNKRIAFIYVRAKNEIAIKPE